MNIFLLAHGATKVDLSGDKAIVSPWLAHLENTAGDNLAKRWRQLGHEVCNYPDERYAGVNIAEHFDAAFLYHTHRGRIWDELCPDWPYGEKPAACLLHVVRTDGENRPTDAIANRFDFLPATCEAVKEDADRYGMRGHAFVTQHPSASSWEWPPSQPSPYSGERPSIMFAGILRSHVVDLLHELVALLPDCDFHMMSSSIYDKAIFGNDPPRNAIPMEDLPCGTVYHPAMAHGTFSQFYWYADVGLDVPASPTQRVANTKLMDYLAAGLPVVSSGFAPGMELAQRLGRIKIADFCNARQTAEMIRETLDAGRQETARQVSREFIRLYHSTDRFAELMAGLFESYRKS
jgi:hypothetical protein